MHIYKWTHIESGKCYIGQSIQSPNQRRLEHINDSKYTKKTYHLKESFSKGKKSWRMLDGKQVWFYKEAVV